MITATLFLQHKPWLLCCAEKDGRKSLQGVWIDPSGVAVATNGHAMIICHATLEGEAEGWEGTLIPGAFLQTCAKKLPKGAYGLQVTIEEGKVTSETRDGVLTTLAIEERFANWKPHVRRISGCRNGKPLDGNMTCINPSLLFTVAKAMGLEGTLDCLPVLWEESDSPALIYGDDCFAVVCPMVEKAVYKAIETRQQFFCETVEKI